MFKTTGKFLLLLLILPIFINLFQSGSRTSFYANGQAADVEIEDDDEGQVETEDEPGAPESMTLQETDDGEDDDEDKPLKPSPDAETYLLFTRPVGTTDLPAGQLVEFLVGFTNKGNKDFTLESLEGSFRYPMDFSFYIQNFSTIRYDRVVKPAEQVTLFYSLIPSETFSSRPFGLTVNLAYKDSDNNMYLDAVFNSTLNIVEIDDGLDGETFFLYIFLAACAVLLLVVGQQFLNSFGKKRPVKKHKIETGTSNHNDVDYDWLPKETLQYINKSPRRSPRLRQTKRRTGSEHQAR